MKTNSALTIYHSYYDETAKIDKWKRTVVPNVMFQGSTAGQVNDGFNRANRVNVFIPYSKNNVTNLQIAIGDVIVKGTHAQEITKVSDLKTQNYVITQIDYNDYSSPALKHISIGAK